MYLYVNTVSTVPKTWRKTPNWSGLAWFWVTKVICNVTICVRLPILMCLSWTVFAIHSKLERWQLTCQFPTWKTPVLCSFDRDNSMYEQQIWMLTLGLLNRNTGCQCCSDRCSSTLNSPMHINSHTKFQLGFSKFQFSTVRTVKRMELHQYAKFHWNRWNRGRDTWISILVWLENAYSRPFLRFFRGHISPKWCHLSS